MDEKNGSIFGGKTSLFVPFKLPPKMTRLPVHRQSKFTDILDASSESIKISAVTTYSQNQLTEFNHPIAH
jgi:hypothetical protein